MCVPKHTHSKSSNHNTVNVEMFYWYLGIPPVLVFQWEVYNKADRLLSGLTSPQQKGTTAQWFK